MYWVRQVVADLNSVDLDLEFHQPVLGKKVAMYRSGPPPERSPYINVNQTQVREHLHHPVDSLHMDVFGSWRPGMTSKADSRWLPSFEKARGRVLIDKLMAGGGSGEGALLGETTGSIEAGSAAGGAARRRD